MVNVSRGKKWIRSPSALSKSAFCACVGTFVCKRIMQTHTHTHTHTMCSWRGIWKYGMVEKRGRKQERRKQQKEKRDMQQKTCTRKRHWKWQEQTGRMWYQRRGHLVCLDAAEMQIQVNTNRAQVMSSVSFSQAHVADGCRHTCTRTAKNTTPWRNRTFFYHQYCKTNRLVILRVNLEDGLQRGEAHYTRTGINYYQGASKVKSEKPLQLSRTT